VTTLVVGTGLVGAHIVRELLARGEAPVGFDLGAHPDNVADLRGRFELISGDIRDIDAITGAIRAYRVESIVNTVALVGPAAEANPYEAFGTNVAGAVNVLEAARRCGVPRVVFYSSNAVFDPAASALPLDENAPKKPAGMNGAAKIAVESIGEAYAAAGAIEFVSLRTGGIYGAGRSSGGLPQQLATAPPHSPPERRTPSKRTSTPAAPI
jgi:nucleoside-diphosphate-sugar epimerase